MASLIGTKSNQVPTCGDLGTMAFQDAKSVNITGGTALLSTTINTGVLSSIATDSSGLDSYGLTLNRTGANYISLLNGGVGTSLIVTSDTTVFKNTANTTEFARISSSGNVGIGVTAPSYKLDVNGTIAVPNFFDNSGSVRFKYSSANAGSRDWRIANDVSNYGDFCIQQSTTQGGATFATIATFSSTGNVGIGVTPSAWNSSFKGLQIAATGAIWAGTAAGNGTYYANNYYFDVSGVRKYITNGYATEYAQVSGTHQWAIAPSSTAGATATLTTAMVLDTSGNLGVGTASPATKLDVSGAVTATKINLGGTTTSSIGAGNASLMKNRLINGGMVIDQRNAGASVTPTVTATYLVDRWQAQLSVASKFSVQQNAGSVTPPAGFVNYLGATSLSAYSIGAGDYFTLSQYIEGFNVADLSWGTANAKTVTLSFQVYSSLTGTFGGSLRNSNATRSYPFTYSIPVANTWTTISITIAGDTTGTWLTNNGTGIQVNFSLGTGTTISGTAGTWAASNLLSATGATSVVGTNGATFYITGVQLEVGSSATGFEYRQYSQELALCQRYTLGITYLDIGMAGYSATATTMSYQKSFPVTMRTTPTITTNTLVYSYVGCTSGSIGPNSPLSYGMGCNASSQYIFSATSGLAIFSAEL